MAFFLSPIGNDQLVDANGNPLVSGTIETYLAGSTTPAATFTSSTGLVAQANPMILNTLGLPSSPVWLTGGIALKFVIKDSNNTVLRTIDNVSGINDASLGVSEWVGSGLAPTFISATSFSVPGDQTSILQVSRRIRTLNASGLVYSTILTSVFGAVTTITLQNDGISVLDSALSKIEFGILSATNPSLPVYPTPLPAFSAYALAAQNIATGAISKVIFNTKEYDTDNTFDLANSRFKPLIPNYYHITAHVTFYNAAAYIAYIYKNGSPYKNGIYVQNTISALVTADVFLNATDYLEIYIYQNTGVIAIIFPSIQGTYFQAHVIRRAT